MILGAARRLSGPKPEMALTGKTSSGLEPAWVQQVRKNFVLV